MADAAAAFLAALDDSQRAKAALPFADEDERRRWAYFPRDFHGLPLLEMDARQRKLAHALVSSGLSARAYAKVNAIVALESVLDEIEGRALTRLRDPGRYFVSVFGAPGSPAWAWRVEGHHVSLNFTIVDGALISPTPNFLGANPAEVGHGDAAVLRPLGEEEDCARDLLDSLDRDQRALATICDVAPPDFVLMNLPRVPARALPGEAGALPVIQQEFDKLTASQREALRFERDAPLGLAASKMDAKQRALLDALVRVYIERLPDELAQPERLRVDGTDADALHFAWAGEAEPHRPHYYRLHGARFLVEYDNTQDGANHVHAVWRDPDGDFGEDLLRAHLAREH